MHVYIPSMWKMRQIVNSRLVWATKEDPISKLKKKKIHFKPSSLGFLIKMFILLPYSPSLCASFNYGMKACLETMGLWKPAYCNTSHKNIVTRETSDHVHLRCCGGAGSLSSGVLDMSLLNHPAGTFFLPELYSVST